MRTIIERLLVLPSCLSHLCLMLSAGCVPFIAASLSARHASVVAAVVQEAIAGGIGTDVEVVSYTQADADTVSPDAAIAGCLLL